MANFKNKVSNLITSQVPDFVLEDHPKFVEFLKTYYIFMEAAELVVTSVETTDGITLETETNQENNLLLDGSRVESEKTILDAGDKIILESSSYGKFIKGETITGQTSKATSTILTEDLNKNRLFIVAQDKFIKGETILGSSSNASAIIDNYRPNPVNNIQELLNFRDPDKVISNFLNNFRNEFLSTFPENLNVNVNKRNLIKNIKSLYQSKGTKKGNELFFRLLFNEAAETIYPREQLLRVSDGKFTKNKILRSLELEGETLNLIGRTITGRTSNATAIVENVSKFLIGSNTVSEFVLNKDSMLGTFLVGEQITGTITDTDDILIKATITGIPISHTITNPGVLHLEEESVSIIGGGQGSIVQTKSISSGNISEIIIDNPGTGYSIGDELIFDNTNTNGAGAAGFISIVNGGIILEDNSNDRITLEEATTQEDSYSGNKLVQEFGTGIGDITDIYLYNSGSGYTKLPTITITSTGNDAILKSYTTTIGNVLDLKILEYGKGYENSPTPPTLNLYKNLILTSTSGIFIEGETVTTSTSVTATVVNYNEDTGLLVLKNSSGTITQNSTILGNSSGSTGTIAKSNSATASLIVGSVADTEGVYINEDGFVSENTIKIQDSLYYQDFSYVIKVGRSITEWRDTFKKTMHTSGFYLTGQVDILTRLNAKIRFPITGAVSGQIDEPLFSIINTLFGTIFGRRLGTLTDGTTKRADANVGVNFDLNPDTINPFASGTRDVTLYSPVIGISVTSRVRGTISGITVNDGFVYAGPRYGTINREIFRTFTQTGTNYSIAELSNNVTFGTKTSLDGNDNTLLFSSTELGRGIKTKLTMPAEITTTIIP
jgi:hypothetical protein